MNENNSGFYKLDGDLLYAPNFVVNSNYSLLSNENDLHTYPIDGWYWFDSEDDAKSFFNI